MKDNKAKSQNAPAPVKSTLNPVKSDSLVIDFESMLVPGSILLAGLMISLSIIFSVRGTELTTLTTKTNTGTTNTGTTNTGTTNIGTTNTDNDGNVGTVSMDDDPFLGDKKKAKVAIIEFSDFECPFCKRHYQQVLPSLKEKYVDTGKVVYVFRDLPLTFHEPAATLNAMAANCVFDQKGSEAYFKMHDLIFDTTKSNNDSSMNKSKLVSLAKKVSGVNEATFTKCLEDKKFKSEIEKDMQDAAKINITGTPGFVIGKISSDGKSIENGTFLGGAYPLENFQTIIDGLLK